MIHDLKFAKNIQTILKRYGYVKIPPNDVLLVTYWGLSIDSRYIKVKVLYNIDEHIRQANIKIKNDNINHTKGDIIFLNKNKEHIQNYKDSFGNELISIIKSHNSIIYKHNNSFYTTKLDEIKADYTNENFKLIDEL